MQSSTIKLETNYLNLSFCLLALSMALTHRLLSLLSLDFHLKYWFVSARTPITLADNNYWFFSVKTISDQPFFLLQAALWCQMIFLLDVHLSSEWEDLLGIGRVRARAC